MNNKEVLNDIIWNLEVAEANLSDDIGVMHCIEEEYLSSKKPQESLRYIYWQLQNLIPTLRKSLEYNRKEMEEAINKYYQIIKEERKKNEVNI